MIDLFKNISLHTYVYILDKETVLCTYFIRTVIVLTIIRAVRLKRYCGLINNHRNVKISSFFIFDFIYYRSSHFIAWKAITCTSLDTLQSQGHISVFHHINLPITAAGNVSTPTKGVIDALT